MSKLVVFPNLREARREASLWVVRVDRGLSAEERSALRAWAATPLNKRALREMAALWKDMSVLSALAEMFPREAAAGPGQPAAPAAEPAAGFIPHRLRGLAAALAGTVVLAIAIGVVVQRQPVPSLITEAYAPAPLQMHATPVGGSRTIALRDGSAVVLNTDTELAVAFEPGHRDLRLARGEAHFRVAHDDRVPFRVFVGGRLVQAVGTAFTVRLREDGGVDVMVTDGTVRVEPEQGVAGGAPLLVTAQQLLQLDGAGHGSVADIAPVEMDIRLAWQRGMLIFQGEPLAEVLAEFGRYTTETLVIADPALRGLRVGGYFRAGDVDALLIALRENFQIDSMTDAHGRIVLNPVR